MTPIIDIHCHVLPGLDDGARDEKEALALLEKAASQGVVGVIATPHSLRKTAKPNLAAAARRLEREMQKTRPEFFVLPGQEHFYRESLPEELFEGTAIPLAESAQVLVEFQTQTAFGQLSRGLRRICDAGYAPILAHVERYGCLREGSRMEELLDAGVRLQMNLESLTGSIFSREVRWCRNQAASGYISFFGTDMHRLDFRPPGITEAVRWLETHLGEEKTRKILYENPMELIQNKRG